MDLHTSFEVKVAKFEGPLDLLLQLVEKHKLHISEIGLAQLSDEYLTYLSEFDDRPKRDMADFTIIASTLMLIKSFSLLPGISKTEEEVSDIEELKRRLALYQEFQEIASELKREFGRRVIYFPECRGDFYPVFAPAGDLKVENLHEGIFQVLSNLPKAEKVPQAVVQKVVSLQQVINDLAGRVQRSMKMNFSEFVNFDQAHKMEVIVGFLGLLELTKQGIIRVEQDVHFGDIALESELVDTPRY